MLFGVLPYFIDEELHLRELVVVVFIEDVGLPGDAAAVLQDEGCADAVEAVEADLREDGPADAAFHHREAGGDVVDVETRVGLLDVLFDAPEAGTLFKSGVGVALDARQLVQRCMRVFTGTTRQTGSSERRYAPSSQRNSPRTMAMFSSLFDSFR